MSRAATWAIACVGLVAAVYGLSQLALGADEAGAPPQLTRLNPAPVSVPPPTPASAGKDRRGPTVIGESRAMRLPFRPPGAYGAGTPERALAAFMAAWRDRHWSRMATWTAAAWLGTALRPAQQLADRFGGRRPHGYLVLSRIRRTAEARYRLLVAYRGLRPAVLRETVAIRVLHDQRPRSGTAPGLRWGVDPATVRVLAKHGPGA